ncbi:cytochrome c biogenesis protein CcdA, partial [Micromonospora aurantiaca]
CGLVLLVAGGYVAWYGWYEVRLAQGRYDAFTDPVIRTAARIQQSVVSTVDTLGPAVLAALLLAALLLAALTRRSRPRPLSRDLAVGARAEGVKRTSRGPEVQDRGGEAGAGTRVSAG